MASEVVNSSEARQGSCSVSSSNGIPVLTEVYNFLVRSDSKLTSRIDILYGTPGLPKVNVTQSAYGLSTCKTVNAVRRENNPLYWDVTATFSSEVEENSNEDPEKQNPGNQNPEAWIPLYETKFERLQENVTVDKDGTVIANSAGQMFPGGITISRFIPVWEFYLFESASLTDEQLADRNETVNEGQFRQRAEKTLLLTVLNSKIGTYYGQRRRLTLYSLKYNKRKWTHKRVDTGTQYKAENPDDPFGDKILKPYMDDDDRTVINGNLDGEGGKLASGQPLHLLEFDIYDPISFSFLR